MSKGTQPQKSHRRSSSGSVSRPDRVGFLDQPALADPGIADEEQDRPPPFVGPVERRADGRHLLLASDERGVHAPGSPNGPRSVQASEHPIGLDGTSFPFELHTAQRLDLEEVGDELVGVLGDLDCARLRRLLHAGGDVHGVTHRRVLLLEFRAHVAHHDRPGVDADADVQVEPSLPSHLLAERRDRGDDLEPCHHGALGVVLVSGRSAEERKDRVAHETGHRPLVPNDRLDQVRERLVHDVGPVLGVELLGHRGRTAHVAEEHRDHTALPGSGGDGTGAGDPEPLPAGVAEPRPVWVVRSASAAARHGANDNAPSGVDIRGRRECTTLDGKVSLGRST